MKTLEEEEEGKSQEEEEERSLPLPVGASRTSSKADVMEVPTITTPHLTPTPGRSHRRNSVFETVFQILRRPSGPSGSRRGSHANADFNLSRRPSPANADIVAAQGTAASSSVRADSRSLGVIPSNHVSFRRPSGIVTFNPELMNAHQKRYIMGLLQPNHGSNTSLHKAPKELKVKAKPCMDGMDSFVSLMSTFYAKLLFFLGVAFPVAEVVSTKVSTHYFQGFYLFLYIGSLAFMSFMYISLLKDKAITQILKNSFDVESDDMEKIQKRLGRQISRNSRLERYGSFYLRLGAVAFGIGAMVYSGLEFGQYFELKEDGNCQNLVQAITPIVRMCLALIQMQFIFLNSKQMEMSRYRGIARFGLMHMVATNLCEWLYVIVEETKHEIIHIIDHNKKEGTRHDRGTDEHDIFECRRSNVMGSLVQDASSFLFPCTIEYSLICAVICFEMWRTVKNSPEECSEAKSSATLQISKSNDELDKSSNHFSVDCSNAHKGLFSGILLLVITIICLIVFFVMNKDDNYSQMATAGVHMWEMSMYILTTAAVFGAGWQMRKMKFKLSERKSGLGLDNILLVCAQAGIFIYCMFSSIACFFMVDILSSEGLVTEVLNLVQSTVQTLFILDATFRRTTTVEMHRNKPGRQIIMFLLVANMSLWLVNTLQKSRAEFRPKLSEFYGDWAWTIITHVSMPLAIFFRFHSTICLFEVWKIAYKFKSATHQRIQLIGASI